MTTVLSLLVKLLQSVFRGRVAIWMQSLLNLEFKSVPFVGDYVLVLFGIGITILMQSSSITTSTLTPLVGVGLIKLEKMLPFTVGANIGTTVTGIMSALASSNIKVGMEVAYAHLFFNIIGTLIWFPLPFMRRIPLGMAKFLGNMAADLRWFPVAYIFVVFAIIPIVFFLLSLAGVAVIGVLGSLLFLALLSLVILTCLRTTRPHVLPEA
jgi:sodium-dependent phosphate cotransporter